MKIWTLHAKKKKLLRLADAEFLAGQTPDLPKLELQLRQLKLDDIQLEEGRPRMSLATLFRGNGVGSVTYYFAGIRTWATV